MAVTGIRYTLDESGRRLTWLDGIPVPRLVPESFGGRFATRLERMVDHEVVRQLRVVERRAMRSEIRRLAARSIDARREAAAALRHIVAGTRRSPRALVRSLTDTSEIVGVEAAESLAAIGDRRALPALWRAIRDRSGLVRGFVAEAIGRLGGPKDLRRLARMLHAETSARARVGYGAGLYARGRSGMVTLLTELLSDGDYRVRCAAANTLARLARRPDVPLLTKALEARLRRESTVATRSSLRSALRAFRERHTASPDRRRPVVGLTSHR